MKRVSPIRALLADYYTKQTGEKINLHSKQDQHKLDQFLQSHRSELLDTFAPEIKNKKTVKEILQLYTRDERAELLIGLRQKSGLDRVPLKDVLSMIEYDGAHGHSLINGHADTFIESTIHQEKYQVNLSDLKVPGIDHTIYNQLDTWVAELVSNGLDATVPEQSIGKFGSGFLSCLSTLGKEADTITIITKKAG